MAILATVQPEKSSAEQLMAAALFARATQSFQASILLTERGMLADARTLTRSVVETAIYLGGIALVDDFVGMMAASNNAHYYGMADGLAGHLEQGDDADQEEAGGLRALLKSVKEGGHRIADIKLRKLARDVGMDPLYEVMYREISGNAAHPSISSAERHIVRNALGDIEKMRFKPEREGLEKTLSMAITAILGAIEPIGLIFDRDDVRSFVDSYNTRHLALAESLRDAPPF